MTTPTLFVVGAPKCGTTALWMFLDQHPDIVMAKEKEPNHFATDLVRIGDPSTSPISREEYLGLFSGAPTGAVLGEASTLHLFSHDAPTAIRSFEPAARIVILVRDPVDFLHSYHLQMVSSGREPVRDLAAALRLEPQRLHEIARRPGHEPHFLHYRQLARFSRHIQRYLDVFAHEQVHIATYDEFRADNLGFVREVYRFVGVDDSFVPEIADHHTTTIPRARRTSELFLRFVFGDSSVKRLIVATTPTSLRRRFRDIVRFGVLEKSKPPIDAELAACLRLEFRPEVERLGELLGRDLVTLWGYPDRV